MKLKILGLLLIVIMYGCSDGDSNVEVIPNLEWEYLEDKSVTEAATPKIMNFENEVKEILLSLVKSWHTRNGKRPGIYPIAFTIFIGESGKVEKIRENKKLDMSTLLPVDKRHPADTLKEYKMDAEVIKDILPFVEKWAFVPANFVGIPVKNKKSFGAYYRIDPSSEDEIEILVSRVNFSPNLDNEYFVAVEEMPSPIGGIKAIAKNVKYPLEAKEAGIEGRVYVKAFIDEEGNVFKSEIIKGFHAGCDRAALDAVNIAKFTPGRQRGKAVKVQVSIPILFKLN